MAEWSPKPPLALYETHQAAFTPLAGLSELAWSLPGQSSDRVDLEAEVNPSVPGTHMGIWDLW